MYGSGSYIGGLTRPTASFENNGRMPLTHDQVFFVCYTELLVKVFFVCYSQLVTRYFLFLYVIENKGGNRCIVVVPT